MKVNIQAGIKKLGKIFNNNILIKKQMFNKIKNNELTKFL